MYDIDALQVKIEQAKAKLPSVTLNAINSVDWRAVIYDMTGRGYTIEQLGDLELETELVLCGLTNPENYLKELQGQMKITKEQAQKLVNEMNEKVFKKIKNKMIEDTKRKPAPQKQAPKQETNNQELKKAGVEIVPDATSAANNNHIEPQEEILKILERPELEAPARNVSSIADAGGPHPIVAQKLSGPMKIPSVKTEHTLENLTKPSETTQVPEPQKQPTPPKYDIDPYREVQE